MLSFNSNNNKFIYPGKNQIDYNLRTGKNIIIKQSTISPKFKKHKNISNLILKKYIFNYNFVKSSPTFRIILATVAMATLILTVLIFSNVFCKTNNDTHFLEYDKFIWPVVMQDPNPFDENNPPTDDVVLNSSVWKAASEKNGYYENYYDSKGKVLVTLEDANSACKNLFGNSMELNIDNLNHKKTFYEFIKEEKTFHVDCLSYDQCYIPNVIDLLDLGSTIILKVNYKTLDSFFNNNNSVKKCMEYYLKKQPINNKFYIYKISNC